MSPTIYNRTLAFIFSLLLFCWSTGAKAQTCTSTLYVKDLRINTPKSDFLVLLPGGGTLLGGMSNATISEVSVVKTNPQGDVVWNKQISFPQYSVATKACLTPNYQVLIAHGTALALLDTNGTFLKATMMSLPVGNAELRDLKMDESGNAIVLYRDINGTDYGYLLAKFSSDLSTLLWTQRFGSFNAYFSSLMVDGTKSFVCGSYSAQANDTFDGTLLCFNNNDGQPVKQKSYTLDGYATSVNTLHKIKDGYLLEGFYQPVGTPVAITSHVVMRLDTALQPIKAVRLTDIYNTESLFIEPDESGGFYGVRGVLWGVFFHCNSSDSVLWTRGVQGSRGGGIEQFTRSASSLYALESSCWTLYKTDLNGRAGSCLEVNRPFQTVPLQPALRTKIPISIISRPATIAGTGFSLTDIPFQTQTSCAYTSSCSTVDIIGSSAYCTSGEEITFTGRRNPDCRLPVQWEVKGLPVFQEQLNDSTLSVRFSQSGTYQLMATLPTECETITDTLSVVVSFTTPLDFDLGPDRSLCPGNRFVLQARKGYASYLWQDGSTDSSYTVTRPGLYHVTAKDGCGNDKKDSVLVSAAPPIPFDLGPDRSKCNTDTLHLSAPSGFISYAWSNNYHISSLTAPVVVVNPLADTAYYIKAEKTPGCFAFDTVRITVNHSAVIDLGVDKSFCSGDSASFTAPGGFSGYVWNNGATAPQITVKSAGSYSLTATTIEGCRSYDTVRVLSVFNNPVVSLDHSNFLCTGTTRILDAGNFASYQWQDGSHARTLAINDRGVYTVEVSDNNGCKGSDTAIITTVLPLPSGFLPQDTSLCTYSSLHLTPLHNYQSYTWSNGATGSSITISQPGLYWVQVKDAYNCTGKDTIVVSPKDCMKGMYVPNAFTPDGDGRNDVFRPLLYGNVKKYRFTVYNRWGQVVFQTTDLTQAWDGRFLRTTQDSNVFVWSCTYQFEGEEMKSEKGTVVLIR